MLTMLFDMWVNWMKERGSWKMIFRLREGTQEPYLERFFLLRIGGYALFLHRFWASDQEGLHDHPWPFAKIVLTGGYYEEGLDGRREWRGPGSFGARSAEVLHRVHLPDETRGKTWTLFAHGRRWRKWGFLDPAAETFGVFSEWISAESSGNQDKRPMRGWVFPRYV